MAVDILLRVPCSGKHALDIYRRAVDVTGSYIHLLASQPQQRTPADTAGTQATAAGALQVPERDGDVTTVRYSRCASFSWTPDPV